MSNSYGVAWISRLHTIIGLFCKRALFKRLYSEKETSTFKEPTNRSHPILVTHIISIMSKSMSNSYHEYESLI